MPPLEEISEIHMEKAFGIDCITRAEGVEVKMGWEDFGEKLRDCLSSGQTFGREGSQSLRSTAAI